MGETKMGDATENTLNGYNSEFSKCLEELSNKRNRIEEEIKAEEGKQRELDTQLKELTESLSRINDSLGRKVSARNEYDTTIQETEAAYLKILESSQTLDHVMKRQGK